MIKIGAIVLFISLLFSFDEINAQDNTINWITKKLLKNESQVNTQSIESSIGSPNIVNTIELDDLINQNTILPFYYWSWSNANDLSKKIKDTSISTSPILKNLLVSAIISEMPTDLKIPSESNLYLTRLNKLIKMGRLKEAQLFIKTNDPTLSVSSDQQFDIDIIRGNDTLACAHNNSLNQRHTSLKKKLYCLSYQGRMEEALITFETAKTLGFIDENDITILDALLSKNDNNISPSSIPKDSFSNLDIVILTKTGINTSKDVKDIKDLRSHIYIYNQNTDKENQIISAEYLTKMAVISSSELFNLYKNNSLKTFVNADLKTKIKHIRSLEKAILDNQDEVIQALLIEGWEIFNKNKLSKQFCQNYSDEILDQFNSGWVTVLSTKMSLLTGNYIEMNNQLSASSNFIAAQGIAKNDYSDVKNLSSYKSNIVDAIRYPEYKEKNITLIEQGKIGEVILESIDLLSTKKSKSNPNLKAGLSGLMQADLKEAAKQLAIEYILAD